MIISHKHKFVFVKTTKTAGTSVEIALSTICGDQDILSRLHPVDEQIRQDEAGRGGQNFDIVMPSGRETRVTSHARYQLARRYLGDQSYRGYFSFAFERNPFDRVVSAYHYIRQERQKRGEDVSRFTFEGMVKEERHLRQLHDRGWGLYTQDGKFMVNQVYRYEDLEGAMQDIAKRIGLDSRLSLKETKKTRRDRDYRSHYTPELRAIVERNFALEIEAFGYSF